MVIQKTPKARVQENTWKYYGWQVDLALPGGAAHGTRDVEVGKTQTFRR